MKSLSILSLVLAFSLTACDAGLGSSETVAAPTGSAPACDEGACPMSALKTDAAQAAPSSDCPMCPSAGKCEQGQECPMDPAQCDMSPAECKEKMEQCPTEQCPKTGN